MAKDKPVERIHTDGKGNAVIQDGKGRAKAVEVDGKRYNVVNLTEKK